MPPVRLALLRVYFSLLYAGFYVGYKFCCCLLPAYVLRNFLTPRNQLVSVEFEEQGVHVSNIECHAISRGCIF